MSSPMLWSSIIGNTGFNELAPQKQLEIIMDIQKQILKKKRHGNEMSDIYIKLTLA
jgi:hypothetical protein